MKKIIPFFISIVIGIVAIIIAIVGGNDKQAQREIEKVGGITDYDEINVQDFDSDGTYGYYINGTNIIDKNQNLTITGTTTLTQSVDGIVVGGTIPITATGTVITLYTNTTGPKYCDSDTSYLYVKNNGSFAPSLVFSVGTSTASGEASKNLIASSTVATTTTSLIAAITNRNFVLADGEKVTAIFGDITNTSASSTYFSNWSAEVGVWCQDISI